LTAATPSSRAASIIIVEDSEELIRAYTRFFELVGLRVLASFHDGVEIVEYLNSLDKDSSDARAVEESVIIMDQRMPRMNGIDATRIIRRTWGRRLKIILVSGDDPSALPIPQGLFDGVLRKPFSMSELLELMRGLSGAARGNPSSLPGDIEA
jgi:CheY-like chemotaxis protein